MQDLKRKLAEISSDSSSECSDLSPKRRLSESGETTMLAEQAASRLSLPQLRLLSASHSHNLDEVCSESCTKRFAHNVLERKRRIDLNTSYQALKEEVPALSVTDRVSKVLILKNSADYISEVETEGEALREELRQLKNHQKHLVKKFRQLFKLTQQNPAAHASSK